MQRRCGSPCWRAAVLLAVLALLIGWTFAETNAVLSRQVARAIAADLAALSEEFERSGRSGVLAAIDERAQADRDSLYLLLSGKGGTVLGGNIPTSPPTTRRRPTAISSATRADWVSRPSGWRPGRNARCRTAAS